MDAGGEECADQSRPDHGHGIVDHSRYRSTCDDGIVLYVLEEVHWDQWVFVAAVNFIESEGDEGGDSDDEGAEDVGGAPGVCLSSPSTCQWIELSRIKFDLPVESDQEKYQSGSEEDDPNPIKALKLFHHRLSVDMQLTIRRREIADVVCCNSDGIDDASQNV